MAEAVAVGLIYSGLAQLGFYSANKNVDSDWVVCSVLQCRQQY
jgi:hypothetical protein